MTDARPSKSFLAVGAIALLIAMADAGWTLHFLGGASRVQGTVISVAWPMDGRGGRSSRFRRDVIVTFGAGERVMQTRHRADLFESFHDGEVVNVAFDPDRPPRSRICTAWQLWGDSLEFLALAAIAFLLALTPASRLIAGLFRR